MLAAEVAHQECANVILLFVSRHVFHKQVGYGSHQINMVHRGPIHVHLQCEPEHQRVKVSLGASMDKLVHGDSDGHLQNQGDDEPHVVLWLVCQLGYE